MQKERVTGGEVFVDPEGIVHEIYGASVRGVPIYLQLRCSMTPAPQFGPSNVKSDVAVTCVHCLANERGLHG